MKHFSIKKSKTRKFPFMPEGTRIRFPKPKIPLVMFWKVHKNENFYLGWDSDNQ